MSKKLSEIKERLRSVKGRKWKYNQKYPMFVGHTNAIEVCHKNERRSEEDEGECPNPMLFDLGRTGGVYEPYTKDDGTRGMRMPKREREHMEYIQALGHFFESCREDIEYLLELYDDEETSHDPCD